jgi:hypothetical protein
VTGLHVDTVQVHLFVDGIDTSQIVQVKTWCIGKPSASYVAKREDVLDVYARPYDPKRPVVCIDEGGKELRDTPHGTLPMQPGQPAKEDYE